MFNSGKSKLRYINPETFENLNNLEELDLSDNEIEEFDESTFEKMKNLKILYLGNLKLNKVPVGIFENLRNLQNISLEGNQLQNIDRSIFKENPKVQNIWLNNNKIRTLNPKTFEGLKNLEYLDLRGNDCIDQYFAENSLQDLNSELGRKCRQDNVVIEEATFRPDTKPSIPRKPKIVEKIQEKPKEIPCDLNYADWTNANGKPESLYTCTIKNQIIDNPGDFIKITPYSSYVQGIRFDNNKKMTELPLINFPNLIKFSAKNTSLSSVNPEKFKDLEDLKGNYNS